MVSPYFCIKSIRKLKGLSLTLSINSEKEIYGPGGSGWLLFVNKTEISYYFIKITLLKSNIFKN